MFSDLAGFTAQSEGRPPEAVVAMLNRYFTRVSRRIAERGGVVDKYIGDAVMAFFGAPVPRDDHAARACLAALDHLAVVDELTGDALQVRIGINTGDMIIGNIGGDAAQDYTVIGDAVNLAQRVESANRVYGTRLLCTDAVRRAAADEVCAREIDTAILPGRVQPVVLHELVGPAGFLDEHGDFRDGLRCYAEGLAALRDRRFAEAAAAFRGSIAARVDDGPASVMLARATAFLAQPPPDDWHGVHRTAR
jgi:class 3 adenylate cyclase